MSNWRISVSIFLLNDFIINVSLGEQCQITVGIAPSSIAFNDAPGLVQDSIGYNALTGKLYSNHKDIGNMRGHRCRRGDTIGIEIEVFESDMSVALFSKNFRPIGTRYLTLRDHSQYFPTILIESEGETVELIVYWQTRVSVPPHYSVVSEDEICKFDQISFVFREILKIGVYQKVQKLI